MTMSADENLTAAQRILLDRLHDQQQNYAAAVALIESLQNPAAAGQQRDLAKLQQLLAAIRDSGLAVQQATAAWQAEGQPRNATLQTALKQQEVQMADFLQKIDSLQTVFQTMKDRLQPQLDHDVTRRSMHQAYQRSMRTGQGHSFG